MNNKIAIMAMGYNRPHSLTRLLSSIEKLNIDSEVPLVISIDAGGGQEVIDIANKFVWNYGPKNVIVHEKKLGLKEHFFYSGDLTEKYDNVLFLEDDLLVSPESIRFADEFISYYKDDERVAGASLYGPSYMEGLGLRFYKIEDGSDVFFFQQPYWGNVWIKEKWKKFKEWNRKYKYNPTILPKHISEWKETSFKKVYIQYLIETDKYFVTPRVSLATNNADPGLHIQQKTSVFQVPYALKWNTFRFVDFNDSIAVYDAFFNINPSVIKKLNPELNGYNFTVDLYGSKNVTTQYILTGAPVKNYIFSYNSEIKPMELAVLQNIRGKGVFLAETTNVCGKKHFNKKLLTIDVTKHYGLDLISAIWVFFAVVRRKIKAATIMVSKLLGGRLK